jgi:hypothetical protein
MTARHTIALIPADGIHAVPVAEALAQALG